LTLLLQQTLLSFYDIFPKQFNHTMKTFRTFSEQTIMARRVYVLSIDIFSANINGFVENVWFVLEIFIDGEKSCPTTRRYL